MAGQKKQSTPKYYPRPQRGRAGLDSTNQPQNKRSQENKQNMVIGIISPRKRKSPQFKDRQRFRSPRRQITQLEHRDYKEDNSKETLKIIPLGGLGEVGKNMCILEYKNEIIIIDVGLGFPEDDMPGVDYVLPNTAYLDGKQNMIKGIIFTHGHMDHIGGLPYLINKLGNPTIYAANLTYGIIIKRYQEFPELPKLNINLINPGEIVNLGQYFEVEFFHVNHNIPDDTALIITTPVGRIVHTADFKFDPEPLNEKPADLDFIKTIGDRGVTVLMSDSTNAEKPGKALSESTIQNNLEIIFKEAQGMIIVGTFSSLINRIQQLVTLSEKYNRKVVFDGYSLKSNVEIAKLNGQIKISKNTQIPIEQICRYPRSKITLIGTGAQGEGRSVLMRLASGEHRHAKIKKGDSLTFSSSVIAGNERAVQRLKDAFYRMGAKVYHSGMLDIHASGHAQQEDLRLMIDLIRPKILMPIHGHYSMMVNHGYIGQAQGIPESNVIIADNGSIVHIYDTNPNDYSHPAEWWFDKKTAPSNNVMVDGLGVGDIGNVVLRDRQVLAEDGMFVIVALVDTKTIRVIGSPEIISRGFIYLKENKELLAEVRRRIRHIIEHESSWPINWVYLKDQLRDEIGLFLFQKTERRPMILPVVIEV